MRPPLRRVTLEFDRTTDETPPGLDLSVVVQVGDDLWLAADESCALERLSPQGADRYAGHRRFALGDLLDLPDGPESEVDIEGMAYDGRALWIVGSHSARRGQAEADGAHPRRELRRLARVKRGGNRYLLARIPLAPDPDVAEGERRSFVPCARAGGEGANGEKPITAARLWGGRRAGALHDALRDDEHLAPYLRLPGKDNGFDVEGLAVLGERLFLGLRGPVLNGWAVVLEVAVEGAGRGELALRAIGRKGRRYRKHFLDLRGMGARELSADGDALLVLAGPTMKLDGAAALFRWTPPPAGKRGDTLTGRDALPKVLDIPYGPGDREDLDHAEGVTLLGGPRREVLVAYDSPSPERKVGSRGVRLDVFALA